MPRAGVEFFSRLMYLPRGKPRRSITSNHGWSMRRISSEQAQIDPNPTDLQGHQVGRQPLPRSDASVPWQIWDSAADSAAHPRRRDKAGVPLEPPMIDKLLLGRFGHGREGYLAADSSIRKLETRGRRKITAIRFVTSSALVISAVARTFRPPPAPSAAVTTAAV